MEDILSKPIDDYDEDFTSIKKGYKTYEGRLKCKIEDWKLYVGKQIRFYDQHNPSDGIVIEVTELLIFDDFAEAFDELGSSLKPNKNRRQAINMYNKLFHYDNELLYDGVTSEMINKEGAVAIGFKIIH